MNQLFTCSWKKKTATRNDTPILWSWVEDHGVRKALFYRPCPSQEDDLGITVSSGGGKKETARQQQSQEGHLFKCAGININHYWRLKSWMILNHTSRQRDIFSENLTYKCHAGTLNHVGVIASKISSPRPGQRVPVHWSLHQRSRSQDVPSFRISNNRCCIGKFIGKMVVPLPLKG